MVVIIALVVAVGYGLATDYEVFLVSRMVEARERGMSTAEAIRIGTATTGRLITAAALVLAVVAGSFVFSDLVLMKYLAFGLMAALLLDATVVRMFLVPSVMKLLGDDCWWAPRWARRLQNRIGLGEIDLPDERKRPSRQRASRAAAGGGQPGRRGSRVQRTIPPIPAAPSRRGHAGGRRASIRRRAPPRANTTRIQTKPSQPTEARPPASRCPATPRRPPPRDPRSRRRHSRRRRAVRTIRPGPCRSPRTATQWRPGRPHCRSAGHAVPRQRLRCGHRKDSTPRLSHRA